MARQVRTPPALAIGALACCALAALSLLLSSGPTYDPYAWLIWGRDLAHLDLVTRGGGTAWKPLPALITALLSPLGHAQAAGWLVVARGGALFACFMAGRLAWRICGSRWGLLAGPVAAATLLLGHDYFKRNALGQGEGLMAGLGLLAIDRHLSGRRGQALAAAVAAGLLRPETWPFVALYAAYLWFAARRPARGVIVAAGLLIPILWFGGDWLGSGSLWTASHRALHSVPGAPGSSAHPFTAVLREAALMLPAPARIAAPVAIAVALAGVVRARGRGKHSLTLALAAGALAWTGIVAAMAARGYAGLPRFLFMALALAAVLAGVGVTRIAQAAAAVPRAIRLRPLAPVAAAACVVAVAVLAAPDVALLRGDVQRVGVVAANDDGLAEAAQLAGGGQRVLSCGTPITPWWSVTALAYDLGLQSTAVHDAVVGRRPVFFTRSSARARHGLRVADRVDGWDVVDHCRRES